MRGFDYTSWGSYFVTVCVQDERRLLGEVVDLRIHLSPAGAMVQDVWQGLPARFPRVALDAWIVMPNHVHGIVVLRPDQRTPDSPYSSRDAPYAAEEHSARLRTAAERLARGRSALSDVIGAFKSITTHLYTKEVTRENWPPFERRLWQRNYYERIIRNAPELAAIREYIAQNPAQWASERERSPFA